MALPSQLYADLTKDLQLALRIDGELFSKKYTRRTYHPLDQRTERLNIYSEPIDRNASFKPSLSVPFRLQLNPSEEDLNKYGLEGKRDALAVFCRYLMESHFDETVKVGDRFDYAFTEDDGSTATEQYEITDVRRTDHFRDTGYFMRYVALAVKTTKELVR